MENLFVQTNFKLNAFKANKIIFDETDMVSIDIVCKIDDKWIDTTLLFTFSLFNDLLRFSGSVGEKLQLLVSDKLLFAKEKPYIISLEAETYVFSSCNLDLYYIVAEDISCFSVEGITPIPYLQQVKNLRKNIKDFADVHINNHQTLSNTLQDMADMYRYYKGLIELNLNEHSARAKAGLSNEHLFKLAFHAAKK